MIVEYRTGQHAPIVIGRDNKKRKNWECTLTCTYETHVEVLEFSARQALASELQPVITEHSQKLFAEFGEPLFVKFKGVSK